MIYNKANGALFIDADGIGGQNQTQLATLNQGLNLTHRDMQVLEAPLTLQD